MSFFEQQGDDSNLQYDDTAFLYFISSLLVCIVIFLTSSIFSAMRSLPLPHGKQLSKAQAFKDKLRRMKSQHRGRIITCNLFIKIIILLSCCGLLMWIYGISSTNVNSLKGFDPHQILGVSKDASLRDIKKAYRKLAMEFHPDKNKGDAVAQNKFILISKSYECFTNQEKKANCFKYGNPDGEGAYRVGIGLPHFFIHKQSQFYVLPIVLFVLLVLIPWSMIRWNNKTRAVDMNGISVGSYPTLFKAVQPKIDKFSIPFMLASYTELSEDLNLGGISAKDKEQLEQFIKKYPHMNRPVYYEMSANQLNILWHIISYSSNICEISDSIRESIEANFSKTLKFVLMFAEKRLNGSSLLGNPEWTIKYQGMSAFNSFIEFQRDFYNKTFTIPNHNDNWLYSLGLSEQEVFSLKKVIKEKGIAKNAHQTIASATKMKQLVSYLPQERQSIIEEQLKTWPVYRIDLKLKVENKEVKQLSNMDYGQIFFKVQQMNKTSGFSYIHNHPLPVKDKVYVLGIEGDTLAMVKEVDIENGEHVDKIEYRTGDQGVHSLLFFVIHQSCWSIDVLNKIDVPVKKVPQHLIKPVHFHKEDVHLQKLYKNIIEQALDLTMDPEQNELSDQEDEEDDQEPQQVHKKEKEKKAHDNCCESDKSLSSDSD